MDFHIIERMNLYVSHKHTSYQSYTADNSKRKWFKFIFHSPLIKVTKMYKDTPNQVALKPTDTISHLIKERNHTQKNKKCALYNLTCRTCGNAYIGQTGRF